MFNQAIGRAQELYMSRGSNGLHKLCQEDMRVPALNL